MILGELSSTMAPKIVSSVISPVSLPGDGMTMRVRAGRQQGRPSAWHAPRFNR